MLTAGQPFTLADVAGSRFEAYDSLARVHALYATLSKDPKLAEFAFLLNWPKLKPQEKRTLYSKYFCHELNFFLFKKDPDFFRDVIRPYLANKKDKTFLDRWLLDQDVNSCLQPWEYGRLNTVERVLLAQRIASEPAKTARDLEDRLRLTLPNLERLRVLFDTAVTSSTLAADTELGEVRAKLRTEALGDLQKQVEGLDRLHAEKAPKGALDAANAPVGGVSAAASGMPGSGGAAASAGERSKSSAREGKETSDRVKV
jgi:hypothetical protein